MPRFANGSETQSPWFSRLDDVQKALFLATLRDGDVVEFRRREWTGCLYRRYSHYGVFARNVDRGEMMNKRDLIIHMTDYRNHRNRQSKCIETIEKVWHGSKARINNRRDTPQTPPRPEAEVVDLAVKDVMTFAAVDSEIKRLTEEVRLGKEGWQDARRRLEELQEKQDEYSLLFNNCEHNAYYWRNDFRHSTQAQRALIALAAAFTLVAAVVTYRIGQVFLADADESLEDEEEDDEDEDDNPDDEEGVVPCPCSHH